MPKVSVIIPCYNMGMFLDEAVMSVVAQSYDDLEILVVDDGSTNEATVSLLDEYSRPKTRIIRTQNQGLGEARNTGIAAAIGEYIMPLDADDRIDSTYIEKAVSVLDSRAEIGIVYCEADLFGEQSGRWQLEPYRFPEILLDNVIFCTGLFRRNDWALVGGYKSDVKGWEDYDFWLSLIALGREVHRIPEPLFHYRIRSGSMIRSMTIEDRVSHYTTMFRRQQSMYVDNIEVMFREIENLREQNGDLTWRNRALTETVSDMQNTKVWKLRTLAANLKRSLLANVPKGRRA